MPSATTSAGANTAPQVADIRARALDAGFDAVGIAPARLDERTRAELAAFVAEGRHGDMAWMSDTLERRGDPQALWPEARSVIVLATNYGPSEDPMKLLDMADRGTISVYARNRDYHDTVKKRLKQVARWMSETYGCQVKVFVDTAPVMEKPLAQLAGLGWQGKHTNLLSRDWGNWLFLGEIFTDLELPRDRPESEHCGSCRKCLDVCPTDAFPQPFQLDATRCISYLTIEHKGHIDREFRAAMGNRIYGCDDCLAVCPWNKFARRTGEADFLPRLELTAPRLQDLARLDDASFRKVFSKSPVKRLGRDRFVRNVLIAIGNSGDPALSEVAADLLDDASPLVRAMAIWALRRLDPDQATRAGSTRQSREPDPEVASEWTTPL